MLHRSVGSGRKRELHPDILHSLLVGHHVHTVSAAGHFQLFPRHGRSSIASNATPNDTNTTGRHHLFYPRIILFVFYSVSLITGQRTDGSGKQSNGDSDRCGVAIFGLPDSTGGDADLFVAN